MNYFAGVLLAIVFCGAVLALRIDRLRFFYPTVLAIIAVFYALFAAASGDHDALSPEIAVLAAFLVIAILGYRFTPWLIVFALAAHGLFDALHPFFVQNRGVPEGWPGFCLAFDAVTAVFLAVVLVRRARLKPSRSTPPSPPLPTAQPPRSRTARTATARY